jgi:hypothetical protein
MLDSKREEELRIIREQAAREADAENKRRARRRIIIGGVAALLLLSFINKVSIFDPPAISSGSPKSV